MFASRKEGGRDLFTKKSLMLFSYSVDALLHSPDSARWIVVVIIGSELFGKHLRSDDLAASLRLLLQTEGFYRNSQPFPHGSGKHNTKTTSKGMRTNLTTLKESALGHKQTVFDALGKSLLLAISRPFAIR